jgi:hypothetical protein
MTALAQALTRVTGTDDLGSLAGVALLSCVGLLVSLCTVLYGFDLGPF